MTIQLQTTFLFILLYPSIEGNEVSKLHIELKVDVDNDESPDITLNTGIDLRNYGFQN